MTTEQQPRFSPTMATLVWFGAAVSITEMMTGAMFAPLGWEKGLTAILLGHLLGGLFFFAAAYIGARSRCSAMESVRMPFGIQGSVFFAGLNVLQLVGWTAIMIFVAAQTAVGFQGNIWGDNTFLIWCLLIGALIIFWIYAGFWRVFKYFNIPVMLLLFVVCFMISLRVFDYDLPPAQYTSEPITFNQAVEFAVIMPLSWLPLVADYTRSATSRIGTPLASTLAYGLGSSWMYAVGLGAAIFSGKTEIASILHLAGPGSAALLTIVLATVTTTFLDAYSAAVSARSMNGRLPERLTAAVVTVIGTVLAIMFQVDKFEGFLEIIGAVFLPMIAVQIADYFFLKNHAARNGIYWPNMLVWLIGFALYLVFTHWVELPVSPSICVGVITIFLAGILNYFVGGRSGKSVK